MFERFPKTRPPLPEAIARIYVRQYRENRQGRSAAAGAAQSAEAWLHRQVAADLRTGTREVATLELGAGTLNQLDYEPPRGPYDIVEPFAELYRDSPQLARVRHVFADIREVPEALRYDRITSCAVLEHLCDLPDVVARSCLLLADGGTFRASIPSEGSWVWLLAWRLTTGLEFWLRHRLDYGDMMRHEHVNTAREIEDVLRYFFGEVSMRVLGVSRRVSMFQHFACAQPLRDRAAAHLASAPPSPAGGAPR